MNSKVLKPKEQFTIKPNKKMLKCRSSPKLEIHKNYLSETPEITNVRKRFSGDPKTLM